MGLAAALDGSDNALDDADGNDGGFQAALGMGTTEFKVKVTAEDTTTSKTYTVTVTKAASQGATALSGLKVGGKDRTLSTGPDNPIEVSVGYMEGRDGVLVETTAGEDLRVVTFTNGNNTNVGLGGRSERLRVEPGESSEVHIVVWETCCPFKNPSMTPPRHPRARFNRCDEYTAAHCYKVIITRDEQPLPMGHNSNPDAPHPHRLRWSMLRWVSAEDGNAGGFDDRWTRAHPDYWANLQGARKFRVELVWDAPDVSPGETILGYRIWRSRYPMDQHYPPHDTPARDKLIADATVIAELFTERNTDANALYDYSYADEFGETRLGCYVYAVQTAIDTDNDGVADKYSMSFNRDNDYRLKGEIRAGCMPDYRAP